MTTLTNRVAGHRSTTVGERQVSRNTTPDLLDVLAELAAMAKQAQQDITAGHALNGQSALRRIEMRARDVTHNRSHT